MLGPLIAVFTESVGGSILDISWAWAIFLIVAGLLQIVVGKISTSKNRAKIMLWGYVLNALFTFTYIFVASPLHLFAVQFGLGIAAALATPTWEALYAKYEDKKQDTYEWGLAGGEGQIITGIAIIIGGLIVSSFSFNVLFVIMGAISTVAAIYQVKILRSVKKRKRRR